MMKNLILILLISADGKSFAYMVSLKFYDAVMFSKTC